MPETVIEMYSEPGINRTFTTLESGANATIPSTSTIRPQGQPGPQYGIPGWNSVHDSSLVSTSTYMPTIPSSSDDPPSYKEAVFGDRDTHEPLLFKPVPSPPRTQETHPYVRLDPSSLIVKDPPPDNEEGVACCIGVVVRGLYVLGIIFGILLIQWEKQFQASFGPNPERWAQRRFGLRAGFGWTLLVLGLLMYFFDWYLSFKSVGEWNSKDLPGHLEMVKGGTPKLTWYMTTFNRDTGTVVVTNADGSRRTEERNDKITTWSGTERFNFSKWTDISPPDQMGSLGAINRITFHSKYVLADEQTHRAYEMQKQAFIDANKDKGQEYSIEEIFEIEGFEKNMETAGSPHGLLNGFTLCTVFFVFGCYYLWLCCVSANTRRQTYTYVKELSI